MSDTTFLMFFLTKKEINMSGRRKRNGLPRVGTRENKIRIGTRDRWVCGICHIPIDPGLSVYESDYAATIDHIMPRMAGGTHEDSNLQISHLKCNLDKGMSGYVGKKRAPSIKMCSKCHEVPARGYCRECRQVYFEARPTLTATTFRIICEETGEEWGSIRRTVTDNGGTIHGLLNHLNGKSSNFLGNHYRIVREM